MIRYENQNPQYIALLEKIEELDKKLGQVMVEKEISLGVNRTYNKIINDYQEEIKRFNALPWYKKMNYKFEL